MPGLPPVNDRTDPDQHADLEVALDFNDLVLELVPGSVLPPKAEKEPELPSIDEFELISSAAAPRPVLKQKDEWFTKVLGQELGPFPFEKLVQMVSEREIGKDDYLRHGRNRPWILAGEIEGLFADADLSDDDDGDFELGVQVDEDLQPAHKSAHFPGFQAVGGEINRTADYRPVRRSSAPTPPETTQPMSVKTASSLSATSAPLASAAPAVPPVKLTRAEKEAARKQAIAAKLSEWLDDKVPTPDPEPEPAEPVAAGAGMAAFQNTPAGSPPASPGQGYPAAAAAWSGNPYGGAATAGSPYAPAARPAPPKIKKTSSGESIFSSLGGLFSNISKPEVSIDPKALMAVGALAIVFALIYLPAFISGSNDMKIYRRYQAMYAELERARASNPGELASLKEKFIPEIKDMVKALEKSGAGAAKPAKQQLFWAGNNCLIPMLNESGGQSSDRDLRFKNHMDTAGRLLKDPSIPPLPPIDPNQVDDSSDDDDY